MKKFILSYVNASLLADGTAAISPKDFPKSLKELNLVIKSHDDIKNQIKEYIDEVAVAQEKLSKLFEPTRNKVNKLMQEKSKLSIEAEKEAKQKEIDEYVNVSNKNNEKEVEEIGKKLNEIKNKDIEIVLGNEKFQAVKELLEDKGKDIYTSSKTLISIYNALEEAKDSDS